MMSGAEANTFISILFLTLKRFYTSIPEKSSTAQNQN